MIMNQPIRIAIVGYGNLGRGVEAAVARCPDMSLSAIYSRRPAASIQTLFGNAPVYEMEALNGRANETDVFVLCGGSKEDLPRQGPQLAALGNTVDSFDTHARIAEYFSAMDEAARAAGHTSIISVGWDPGLFSIHRVLGEAFLPDGDTYTFWGKGVSQGHSDALRRVEGVADGVQYTVPIERAIRTGAQRRAAALFASSNASTRVLRGVERWGQCGCRTASYRLDASLFRRIRDSRHDCRCADFGCRASWHGAWRIRDSQWQDGKRS